jgi:indole-3-glycerol phosphate synthase
MSDILNKILAVKAQEVAAAKQQRSYASLRAEVESNSELRAGLRGFEAALRSKIAAGKPAVIAKSRKPRRRKA